MGCCLSTDTHSAPSKDPRISDSKTAPNQSNTNPLLEEETVKEVLSETPTIRKQHRPSPFIPRVHENRHAESPFIKAAPLLLDFSAAARDKRRENGGACKKPFAAFSNEDLSEICSSLSESISASTTATGERENKGDRNDELREHRQRSPARTKNRSLSRDVKREKTVERSPGRRSEPSPHRVTPGGGSGHGRKRDIGESSGRRSRSPVRRTEPAPPKTGLGRSQSFRKTGTSPGRVGSGLGERTRKLDPGRDNKWAATGNDSLENPLVSLECFIFL